MTKAKTILYLLLLGVPMVAIGVHVLYLQNAIANAFNGNPDSFMQMILDSLYPRFQVEKNRFDLAFFLSKANQVIYRFVFFYYGILGLFYFAERSIVIRQKINSIFYTETTTKNTNFLRVVFYTYLTYPILDLCQALLTRQALSAFYTPISFLKLFSIPYPSNTIIYLLGIVSVLFIILIISNFKPVLFSTLLLVLFIVLQAWFFSFEKIDHGYVTITYAMIILPFLFSIHPAETTYQSWALQLIRISIAMVYFLSGLEKLFIAQFSWLNPENLKAYLAFHETYLSKIIVQYDFLCSIISAGVLLFQLSFILIIFIPKQKWIWIVGGMLFHTGTLLVMNIGHPLNPWILAYLFFIDWTKTYDFLVSKFGGLNFFSNRNT